MGEIYLFLDTASGEDDPPVHLWSDETDPETVKAYASFWDWIDQMIDDTA